jgi:hypothetical protein
VTSATASSTEAAASASGEPVLDGVVAGQPTLNQGGDVGAPVPPVASEAAEGSLGEPAAGAASVVAAPPPSTEGADVDAPPPSIAGEGERAAEVVELSSLQLAAAIEEVAPTTSQPPVVPQEQCS